MKTKLSFLLCLIVFSVGAQTTHQILWKIGANGAAASLTIDVGDTVEWVWDDTLPHTVTSDAGSVETFDSGNISGLGQIYSQLFSVEGDNPYRCSFHPGSMSGTISVLENLSVDEEQISSFRIIQNPTKDYLQIQLPQRLLKGQISIIDMLGKSFLVKDFSSEGFIQVDVSTLKNGLYLISVETENLRQTKRFIKQ